jgi:hypothetical protein
MSKIDLFAPITRLSGLGFIDEGKGTFAPLYPPNLTSDQIVEIPITPDLPGAIVFNTSTEELETYSAAGFWLPILTAESDITFEEITADSVNATSIITSSMNATTVSTTSMGSTAINNNGTISTTYLNVIATMSAGGISASNLEVSADFVVEGAMAGGTASNNISQLTVALSTGAGTGATSIINGSITSGVFSLTTGSAPATGGVIGTFTIPASAVDHFTGSYGVMFSAANALTLPFPVYVTTASPASTFTVGLGATTLEAATAYKWNYHIIGSMKV